MKTQDVFFHFLSQFIGCFNITYLQYKEQESQTQEHKSAIMSWERGAMGCKDPVDGSQPEDPQTHQMICIPYSDVNLKEENLLDGEQLMHKTKNSISLILMIFVLKLK